jgi:hypothetical protein
MNKSFWTPLPLILFCALPLDAASAFQRSPGAETVGTEKGGEAELDRTVCRRDIVTGSRAKTRRTCKTVREWRQASGELKETWADFIQRSPALAEPINHSQALRE